MRGAEKQKIKPKIFEKKKVLVVYIICNAITFLTLTASIISTFIFKNRTFSKMFEHIALCLIAILFYNLPVAMRVKYKVKIPSFLEIVVTFFAIAHFVLGEIFRIYDRSIIFDKVLHTTSGVIFGVVGFSLINIMNSAEIKIMKLSPLFVALFSFCFALAIGYVWELFEYFIDTVAGANMQRWQDSFYLAAVNGEEKLISDYGRGSGLTDTMGDMIVNAVGAIVICVIGFIYLKSGSPKIENILIRRVKNQEEPSEQSVPPQNVSEDIDNLTDKN